MENPFLSNLKRDNDFLNNDCVSQIRQIEESHKRKPLEFLKQITEQGDREKLLLRVDIFPNPDIFFVVIIL